MASQMHMSQAPVVGAPSTHSAWLQVFTAATLWGATGVVFHALGTKSGADAVSISCLRLLLAVPFLLLMARVYAGAWLVRLTPSGWLTLTALGLSMAFYQLTYVLAIERVGVAISVLISICGAPVFVALIQVLWSREPLHPRTVLAMVVAIVGTVLLVGVPSEINQDSRVFWMGVLIAVLCAVCQAFYVLAAKAAGSVCSPMHAGGIGFGIGAVALLPFAAFHEGLQLSYSLAGWAMLIYVAAVPTALAQTLFMKGLKGTGAIGGAIASLLEPLVATILAVVLLSERLTWYGVLGAVILLSGILIVQSAPRSSKVDSSARGKDARQRWARR